jgi:CheY-like chemotaxis protein
MSLKEKIDVLDFLISILKEHEESLYEITERLERLSERLEKGELKSEDRVLIEEARQESEKAKRVVADKIGLPVEKSDILLVDDDEFLTETFKVILETVGYNVDVASTGMQAIHKAKDKNYDLVILDLKLPDINGDEVARILKKQGKKNKIVMITGYEKLVEGLKEDPVDVKEVLMKPVSPNNLLNVTKKILEENR